MLKYRGAFPRQIQIHKNKNVLWLFPFKDRNAALAAVIRASINSSLSFSVHISILAFLFIMTVFQALFIHCTALDYVILNDLSRSFSKLNSPLIIHFKSDKDNHLKIIMIQVA